MHFFTGFFYLIESTAFETMYVLTFSLLTKLLPRLTVFFVSLKQYFIAS